MTGEEEEQRIARAIRLIRGPDAELTLDILAGWIVAGIVRLACLIGHHVNLVSGRQQHGTHSIYIVNTAVQFGEMLVLIATDQDGDFLRERRDNQERDKQHNYLAHCHSSS